MSDTSNDTGPDIKSLRDAAERGKQAATDNEILRRENLFLRAGIDTTKGAGKLLFKAYDGDLTDVEALRVEALDCGALAVVTEQPTGPDPREAFDNARAGISGAPAAGGTAPEERDPWDATYEQFHADRKRGTGLETAQLGAVDNILNAARRGDPRVIHDQEAWNRRASAEGERMRAS